MLHIGGRSPSVEWIKSKKLNFFFLSKPNHSDDDDSPSTSTSVSAWVLTVGRLSFALVLNSSLSLPAQRRVDLVADGVWARKFFSVGSYHGFLSEYQKCLCENTYDAIWEDAEESFEKSPRATAARGHDLLEEFEEEAGNDVGTQSLALGALANSFLVSDSGVFFSHGVHGKGVSVKLMSGNKGVQYETLTKAEPCYRREITFHRSSPA